MKTVQEYLRELDRDRLIEEYLYKSPIEFEKIHDKSVSVETVFQRVREYIGEYIDRLRKLDITQDDDGKQGIVFAHRCVGSNCESLEIAFPLVFKEELLEHGTEANSYAYEFSPQSEIVGYLVADNPLTQYYIYDLLADVMFEAAFFGFDEEHKEEEEQKVVQSCEEAMSPDFKGIPWEEVKAHLEEKMGQKFDEESEDELEYHRAVWAAEMEYSQHSRTKEMNMIIEALKSEGN